MATAAQAPKPKTTASRAACRGKCFFEADAAMRGFLVLVAVASLLGGGWYFYDHYEIEGLSQVRLAPKNGAGAPAPTPRLPAARGGDIVKILVLSGETLAADEATMTATVALVADYDLACIHGIRTPRDDLMFVVADRLAESGMRRSHYIGPRVGDGSDYLQYAFLYDPATIEMDAASAYVVDDRDDALTYDPLVGHFRARGPSPSAAITFSVMLWQTHADRALEEAALLGPLVRTIRRDGSGEDDLLVAAQLGVDRESARSYYHPLGFRLGDPDSAGLGMSGGRSELLLFDPLATKEFSGAAGSENIIRRFNFSVDEATARFGALPVWLALEKLEGGGDGRVSAERDDVDHF